MPSIEDLTARVRTFVAERDWQQFHTPKNLAMALAAEAGRRYPVEASRGSATKAAGPSPTGA